MSDPRVCLLRELAGLGSWSVIRGIFGLRNIKQPLIAAPFTEEQETWLEQAETRIARENPHAVFLLSIRAVADMLVMKDPGWLNGAFARTRIPQVSGLSPERAADFSWSFVPCLLADGADACVRHLFCGLARDGRGERLIPPWARPLFDPLFIQSMETAHGLLGEQNLDGAPLSFGVFPLAEPVNYPLFCGDSAGLPVYLGGRQLLEGKTWPGSVAATGRLESGKIGAVGHVREKMAEARKAGARIFIYPGSCKGPGSVTPDDPFCLPVTELSWALHACDLGRLDQALFHRILEHLSSPGTFAAFCGNIPDSALMSLAGGVGDRLAHIIVGTPDLFERFVKSVETLMRSRRFPAAAVLVSLFNPVVEKAENLDPVCWVRWSVLNLELANHRGDLETSRIWADRAGAAMIQARTQPEGRRIRPWFENHDFVAACHNRYDFKPEQIRKFDTLVMTIEQAFHGETEGVKGAVEPSLGAIYGTMAQHYGFCGPSFLPRMMECAQKAMACFGGVYGQSAPSRIKEDFLRQYNYITYAFLDAGNTEEARRHLLLYLEQPDLESVVGHLDVLSEWELVLVARYMADAGDGPLVAACVEFAGKARENRVAQSHPWQLWCLNMARCALKTGDTHLARELAFQSLDICRSARSGDAMNVMALLPLSFLHAQGLSSNDDLALHYRSAAEKALCLNPDHFAGLNPQDCEAGLADISRRPAAFFPFSYR